MQYDCVNRVDPKKRIYILDLTMVTNYYKSILLFALFSVMNCLGNLPYSQEDKGANIHYRVFAQEPHHLDPVRSYSSNEYQIIAQVYETLFEYHYLKRPYQLKPLAAQSISESKLANGGVKYRIKLRQDLRYQNHAAFAQFKDDKKNGGGLAQKYIYHLDDNGSFKSIDNPNQLKHQASRKVTAHDYVYQVKRIAAPFNQSPIHPILSKYIEGFTALSQQIANSVKEIRNSRKVSVGAFYNQEVNEKEKPIYVDMRNFKLSGFKALDDYTLEITLKQPYPQIRFWLAMPFFAPIPWEVMRFFKQPAAAKLNLTLDRHPVGSGPYKISKYEPNYRIEMVKNKNYHDDFYPSVGEKSELVNDEELGLLKHAGKKIPFIDKITFVLDKESIPTWIKFMQGYYDSSGVSSDVFDSVIKVSENGRDLTEDMLAKGIQMRRAVSTSLQYYGFNMDDPIYGGYTDKKGKLRRAISIAIDVKESIQIFLNDRGEEAHNPIPPGIFGHEKGELGYNKYLFDWNKKTQEPVKKSLAFARKLMQEAGYKDGIDSRNGKALILKYDTTAMEPSTQRWLEKKLKQIGIELQVRQTDYNQFQKKMRSGNFQFFSWGWNADYPDPENFLFLLFGGNKDAGNVNAARYDNPKFNQLFKKLENLPNSPKRLDLIRKAVDLVRKDAPWVLGYYPIGIALVHSWYENIKPLSIGNNDFKYRYINIEKRNQYQSQYNQVMYWPFLSALLVIILALVYAFRAYLKRDKTPNTRLFKKEVL